MTDANVARIIAADLSTYNTQLTLTYEPDHAPDDLAAAHDCAVANMRIAERDGGTQYIRVTEKHSSGAAHHHVISNAPLADWSFGSAKIGGAPEGGFNNRTVAEYFAREPDALVYFADELPAAPRADTDAQEDEYPERYKRHGFALADTQAERERQFARGECHYWDIYPDLFAALHRLGAIDDHGEIIPEAERAAARTPP